jgi:MFS family permease
MSPPVPDPTPPPAPASVAAAGPLAAPPAGRGIRHAARAFHHRDFTVFWLGALASNTGSWVQNIAVPIVIYRVTHSASWVGFATFSQFVPVMLLGPMAGSIADRFDRRKVLLTTQALMALGALALWLAWSNGIRSPWAILGLVAVSGVFAGINIPSWQAFVNDLVPRDDLLSAVTLNSLQFNAARALGPGIGGILVETLGPGWAFFINGVSFLCVLLALALVRNRQVALEAPLTGGVIRQFRRAVRYTRGQPGIFIGIVVAVLVGALGNPIFQFTVIFSEEVWHVGAIQLSLLNVALGVGAVASAPLVSGWDLPRATLVRLGLFVYGGSILAFALAPGYLVGLVASLVVGGGFLVVISATNTSVQVIVADHMRGRVMAFRIMAFTGAYPIGALIQGWLSDAIGPRQTVGGAGALLVVAGVVLASRPKWLYRLDDPHDEAIGVGGD